MHAVTQFLIGLRNGTFPPASMRDTLEALADKMSADERTEAIDLIVKWEATPRKPKKGRVLEILPEGWLREYVLYCQANEAPDTFHLFSAIAVLSHMMGRRMWLPMGPADCVFAPVSVFFVSPAGAVKRSTAAKIALRVGMGAGAKIVKDQATPEGLVKWMSEDGNGTALLFADEAATLLSKADYMLTAPQLLCSLLDCPDTFEKTLAKQTKITVEKPTLNVILTCAPEWILTSMPKSAVGGGLWSRVLIVYEPDVDRLIPLPYKVVRDETVKQMGQTLANGLATLVGKSGGEMKLAPKAEEMFERFYYENHRAKREANEKMLPYMGRKPTHALRLAMTLTVSGGGGREISEDVLETAFALLAVIEDGMRTVYQIGGMEKVGQDAEKVLALVRKAGGRMGWSDLMRRCSGRMNAKQLRDTVETLEVAGMLTRHSDLVGNTFSTYVTMKEDAVGG